MPSPLSRLAVAAVSFAISPLVTAAPAQVVWLQISPANSPSVRSHVVMTPSPSTGRILLFGGHDGTELGDTWEWTGQNWQSLTPSTSPSPREFAAAALYASIGRVVLFGGGNRSLNVIYSDTWEWDGATWTQRFPPNTPPGREMHAMACDPNRGRIVLFGGWDSWNGLGRGDTWEWDGSNWSQMNPASSPVPRSGPMMSYEPNSQRTVLFGGADNSNNYLGDTWEWNGVNWVQRFPTNSPPGRRIGSLTWDPLRERLILYGGNTGTATVTDTWEWDGVDWSQRAPATSPPDRNAHGAAFDETRSRLVIFGGSSYSVYRFGDTWEYGPVNPATVAPFGTGCPGSAGIPSLTTTALPWLGDNWVFEVSNLAPTAAFALLVAGLSDQTWSGLSLPLSLQSIGMPGCDQFISADAVGLMALTGTTASYNLPIPNQSALLGVTLFHQAAVFEAGANAAGFIVSNATRSVLGGR